MRGQVHVGDGAGNQLTSDLVHLFSHHKLAPAHIILNNSDSKLRCNFWGKRFDLSSSKEELIDEFFGWFNLEENEIKPIHEEHLQKLSP